MQSKRGRSDFSSFLPEKASLGKGEKKSSKRNLEKYLYVVSK